MSITTAAEAVGNQPTRQAAHAVITTGETRDLLMIGTVIQSLRQAAMH